MMVSYCGVLFTVTLCALAGLDATRILQQNEAVRDDSGSSSAAAFLSDALPLEIAIATPEDILGGSSPLLINDQQAITVSEKSTCFP